MRIAPVYELVKSLSVAELKQLKRRSESPKSAYLTLLDIMKASPLKSEATFKARFSEVHPEINYAETKSYLYKFLLQHLTEIHHHYNPFTEINYSIATAEVLHSKGVHREAIKILNNAYLHAEAEGYHQLSVVALKRMKNITLGTSSVADIKKEFARIHQLETDASEKDAETREAMMLYSKMLMILEADGIKRKAAGNDFRKLMAHPIIKNRNQLKSVHARLVLFDLVTNYYQFSRQYEMLIHEYKSHIKAIAPRHITNPYYAYRYIFVLFNLISQLKDLNLNTSIYEKKLAEAPTPDVNSLNYKQLFILQTSLNAQSLHSNAETASVLTQLKTLLQKKWMDNKPIEKITLALTATQELFKAELYEAAADAAMLLWQEKSLEKMFGAVFTELRLFMLAALYEQKKYAEMEPAIRALKYDLKSGNYKGSIFHDVAALFQKLYKQPVNNNKAISILKKIAQKNKHPEESYFLFSGWPAKLEKKLLLKRNLK